MSANDWKDLIYKVFYKEIENPLQLQIWLENMYQKEGLSLVSFSGEYFVFKPQERQAEDE